MTLLSPTSSNNPQPRGKRMSGYKSIEHWPYVNQKKCHRCESFLSVSSEHSYCQGCNWDSLTDPINSKNDHYQQAKAQNLKNKVKKEATNEN